MTLPSVLPDKFLTSFYDPDLCLLTDLFDGCANLDFILPQRPWEDGPTYEYRRKSWSRSFPLRSAVNQVIGAIQSQPLTTEQPEETTETDYLRAIELVGSKWAEKCLGDLTRALLLYGDVHLLSTVSEDGEPCPRIITPAQTVTQGPGYIIWREFQADILDLETMETSSYGNVYILADGELGHYQAKVKKVAVPSMLSRASGQYQSANAWAMEVMGNKSLKLMADPQAVDPAALVHLSLTNSVGVDSLDLILNYLRTHASILDIANSAGYVQRVLTPEAQGSLDLPVDLEEVDTSGQHLIRAERFTFSEMAGTSVLALNKILENLADEQLRELGLNLSVGASASGDAREIDSNRLKALVDQIGQTIQAGLSQVAQTYTQAYGLPADCMEFSGLTNYSPRTNSGVIDRAQSVANLLNSSPYQADPETWATILKTVPGIPEDMELAQPKPEKSVELPQPKRAVNDSQPLKPKPTLRFRHSTDD